MKLTLVAALGCCLPALQWCAPCHSAAALTGAVRDPSGAVIVGAKVVLEAATPLNTLTDVRGRFSFDCVSSGAHTLRISADGFATQEVKARHDGDLSIKLAIKTATQDITVSGDEDNNASLDADHGSGTRLLTQKDLAGMADDPDELRRQLQVLAASGGSAPGQAVVAVDGFDNDIGIPTKSAIASIRVNPDLFSAEYDKPPYQGARIEVFTKPGDTFHGSLFASESNAVINANDPLTPAGSTPASKADYGFEFGGPVIKNTGDFFVALEKRDTNEFNTVNATVLNASGVATPLQEASPAPETLWNGTLRTDWKIGAVHTLAMTYSEHRNEANDQGSGGLVLPEAGYHSLVNQQSVRLTDTGVFSANLLSQTRLGMTWNTTQDAPLSTAPSVNVAGAMVGGGSTVGALKDRERDIEADEQISWTHNNHSFTFGVKNLAILARVFDPDTFNGQYLFTGELGYSPLLQYRYTLLNVAGVAPTTYQQTTGTPRFSYSDWQVALYAQDEWKVAPNFSLSLGLRYEIQTAPSLAGDLAPRFGLAWSPGRRKSWVIRAHAGMFYSPVSASVLSAADRLNGITQTESLIYSPLYSQPLTPALGGTAIQTVRELASGITEGSSLQAQIAVEKQLPQHWHVQGSWSYAYGWNLLRSVNINAPLAESAQDALLAPRPIEPSENILQFQPSGLLHGPIVFLGADQHSYKHVGIFAGYLYMDLKTDADTPMLEPQSSYSNAGEMARASWEPSSQIFGMTQISLPWKVSLSSQFTIVSGVPYNISTGSDNNGDGSFNDRPSIVSQPGPGVYATPFGLLSTTALNGTLPRNAASMPTLLHIDTRASRIFALPWKALGPDQHQSLTVSAEAYNLLNHTNVTQVGGVAGSPSFMQPLMAEPARRIELGLRYSF